MARRIDNKQLTVARAVRMLMAGDRLTHEQLGQRLGISADSARSKTTGRRAWTLDEVCELAAYFDVPITELLGTTRLPRPDSNGEPAG